MPWRFVRCAITEKFLAGLLIRLYVPLFMTHSGVCPAQSLTDSPTKLKNLSENQTISVGKKEPIGSFRISSPFGWRVDPITGKWAQHQGVDIAGKRGTPILAPAKGQVCLATYQSNLVNLLEIDHGNGYVSRYGHLDRFAVKEGDWVREGEHIASLGSTGRAAGPHLHYELRYRGKLVNPAIYPISVFEDKGQGATSSVSLCRSTVDHKRNNTLLTEPPKQFIKNDALKNRDNPSITTQGNMASDIKSSSSYVAPCQAVAILRYRSGWFQ
jgi:murein DD-endopeptidase MepM/ murein hydrolase activator NlpD